MLLSIMDREGVARRKGRRLKRRIYQNKVCCQCETVDSHIYCFLSLLTSPLYTRVLTLYGI